MAFSCGFHVPAKRLFGVGSDTLSLTEAVSSGELGFRDSPSCGFHLQLEAFPEVALNSTPVPQTISQGVHCVRISIGSSLSKPRYRQTAILPDASPLKIEYADVIFAVSESRGGRIQIVFECALLIRFCTQTVVV